MVLPLQILVIAVLMRSILHRSFNVLQWEALVLLVAGITVNQLNYCTKDAAGTTAFLTASVHEPLCSLLPWPSSLLESLLALSLLLAEDGYRTCNCPRSNGARCTSWPLRIQRPTQSG